MSASTLTLLRTDEGEQATIDFYRDVMEQLAKANIPFLVGGAHAFHYYTGVVRNTKDFDLFIRRQDYDDVSAALNAAGYRTEMSYPHWLAKTFYKADFVDLIFSSGNAVATVDDAWFEHAKSVEVLGMEVKICPAEEMMWSKTFVMERERYDGADVAHLLQARAAEMDWQRVLRRFADHWRVLLSHLILFGFIYPDHRHQVPVFVMENLIERLRGELDTSTSAHVCGGTLLSRQQYGVDVEEWGYQDARLTPKGNMSAGDIAQWTAAIPKN